LVSSSEEYDRLFEAILSLPPDHYSVLRSGIWFTVLGDKSIGEEPLIYHNDLHTFVTEVRSERTLQPLRVFRESEQPSLREFTPSLFIEGASGTYNFGLAIPD
jgi:hypothetical protein